MARHSNATPSEYMHGTRPTRHDVPFLGAAADSKRDAFGKIEFSSTPDDAPHVYRKPLRFIKQLLNMADKVNDKRLRGG